jgi:hypothetical protein
MYFDGENIYYVPYYYQAKGIYKIDLQGNVKKIYNGASLQLWITESEIYFVNQIGYDDLNQNPQGTLCVMDKDGQDVKELAKNIKNYFFIQNEKIYYTTQDRKMYAINLDGSEPVNLVQGRKFVIASSDNYIVYVDYANQEANHILNTKTNEDIIVGYFGETIKSQGKTYLNTRKILEDGAIDTDYTLFEIDEDGNTTEIGNVNNLEETIKYIANEKLYASNQQEGTYIIDLENKNKENASNYNNCSFYIGGYGYKIENSEDEEIIIEKLEL